MRKIVAGAAWLGVGLPWGLPCAGQDLAWKLPLRGAAEYRRELTAGTAVADDAAAARQLTPEDALAAPFVADLLPASWLCQGELAPDQRRIGDPPRDLRDVVRAVACDLSLRGSARLRLLRVMPFGDLAIAGTVQAPAADGLQQLEFTMSTDDPESLPGEDKAVLLRHVVPLYRCAGKGVLSVERQIDAAQGLVRQFRGTLDFVVADGQKHRRIRIDDRWTLVAVHENQDAAFRTAVAEGIRAGSRWVRRELENLGHRQLVDGERDRSYGSGRLALGLLTLLKAEIAPTDPVLQAGFAELRRRDLVDTYSLGVALMAMEARYTPPHERERLLRGEPPSPRQLDAEDRELAAAWVDELLRNLDTRVDKGYRLRFNYTAGPRFDNSVQQYGLLGLWSAHLCGVPVPPGLWRGAAAHQLEVQCKDIDREVRLLLRRHAESTRAEAAAGTRTTGARTKARGYAYQEGTAPAYGSMTTAGLTSLVLARAGLVAAEKERSDLLPRIDAAIAEGFAWLQAEFSVRSNPGFVGKAHSNWYYYLYGLERAGELAGVAHIGERDWYYEGALQLLARQAKSGRFPPELARTSAFEETCFAVLFLKKATLPTLTGPAATGR